jgi:rare lipoprotein A (peptidoglycan hydrolase)
MRMRKTIGLSLALLVASTAAIAGELRSSHHHPASSVTSKPARGTGRLAKIHRQRRRAAQRPAQRAERRHARHLAAIRRGGRHSTARRIAGHPAASRRIASRRTRRHDRAAPPPDRYIGGVRTIGRRQIGEAAWYGESLIGHRTASGERLDRVHVTAAHRWLPLFTLVRVTNLRNGRSVIATINDRGPVSHRLLIDLSPKAARALHMMHSGVARVAVVPVVVRRPAIARPAR